MATIPYLVMEEEERCMLCSYFILKKTEPSSIKLGEGSGIELLSPEEVLERDDLTEVPRRILEERVRVGAWPSF